MKKFIALFLTLCLMCLAFASCGANSESDSNRYSEDAGSKAPEISYESKSEGVAEDEPAEDVQRKIIKTYHLSLETKNFASDADYIISKAEALGGYVADSSVSGNRLSSDSSSRSARYTIRIPAKSLDAYITAISEVCNVYSSSLTTEDVTDSYYGIKSQLESLVIQEQKLNDMLKEAKTLQDMIMLDDKLTSVRSEINALNYRLQNLDKSVNYSYVYIALSEVQEYHVEEKTYWQELGDAVVGSIENFVDVLGNGIILIVWILPFGIVITAIVLLIIVFEKISRKKRLKKRQNESEQ